MDTRREIEIEAVSVAETATDIGTVAPTETGPGDSRALPLLLFRHGAHLGVVR
jgi:hypothetical protein